jgi:molybdate transport system ATP-binding protein
MLRVDVKVKVGSFNARYKFGIEPDVYGVFGNSGHGKTTLFKTLSGLITPEDGDITLNNRVLYSRSQKVNIAVHKRRIGFCFQDYRLFDHLTVLENITAVKRRKANTQLLDEIISISGLEKILHQKCSSCSGGERQRTALARALYMEPELLLLDEPFSALDAENIRKISALIHRIVNRFSIPVLVISHQLEDIQLLTDNILIIHTGTISFTGSITHYIFENGTPASILSRYKNLIQLNLHRSETASLLYAENNTLGLRFVVDEWAFKNERNINAIVPAAEIFVSTHKLSGISARNSLQGHVKRMVTCDEKTFCFVDVGTMLIAEITTLSANELQLKAGSAVWCHFKSVVLEFM